jgi:hypothetical protein
LREEILDWAQMRYQGLVREGAFQATERARYENESAEELSRLVRKISGSRPFVIVHLVGL